MSQVEAISPEGDDALEEQRPAEAQRADMMGRLVDVLSLPTGQVNDNERAFTADILNQLFDYLTLDAKIEASERLAAVLAPPPQLLRRMLLESIEVAGPLLKELRAIPDSLLIEAAAVGPEHRAVIVRRIKISEYVVDAVLEADDAEAAVIILRRPDVLLSERRLDELVPMTEANLALRGPLLSRIELQPRHGFMMFWWLNRAERRRVLQRFATDRTIIQDSLKNLYREVFPAKKPDPVAKNILKLCDRRHRARGKNGETISIDMVKKTLTNAIANPTPDFCVAIAYVAGISPETAKVILLDHGGESFAILAKAVGLSRSDFQTVIARAQIVREADSRGMEFDDPMADYVLGVFDMIARDYSRTILRYWDWKRASLAEITSY